MALPCGTIGSLSPTLRPGLRQSRSQAPLCLYTLRMISIHSEEPLGASVTL